MMPAIAGALLSPRTKSMLASESIATVPTGPDSTLPADGQEKLRRDPGLDRGCGEDDRHGQGDRDEGRGEQLVPASLAARDRPCGERQEQRGQLGNRVHGEDPDQLR